MLDVCPYTTLGLQPDISHQDVLLLEASTPAAENTKAQQAWAILINPLSRYKYDNMVATQMRILQLYQEKDDEELQKLDIAQRRAGEDHERIELLKTAMKAARQTMKELAAKLPLQMPKKNPSIEEYAAVAASLPSSASWQPWEWYADWWFAKDKRRRLDVEADDLEEGLIRRLQFRKDDLLELGEATEKKLASLWKEHNLQLQPNTSEDGCKAAYDGKEAGTMAALKWIEETFGEADVADSEESEASGGE